MEYRKYVACSRTTKMINTCTYWVVLISAISIGYILKKRRLIEDFRLNGLDMKMLDDLHAHPIWI